MGRESVAGELFGQALGYYEKLQKAGKLTSYEPVILPANASLNGFIILRGTHANLDVVRNEDEFVDLSLRGQHCLEDFFVMPAYVGTAVTEVMARWMKQIPR
ncbi:MAG: hypothetical protein WCJ30_01085 [Deltaproteobacteria bacterium]